MASEPTAATESAGSSPPGKSTRPRAIMAPPPKPPVGTKFSLRTESPSLPLVVDPAFAQSAVETLAAGNQAYTIELKEQGHLGLFLERSKTTPFPRYVALLPTHFFDGIKETLYGSLLRLLKLKTEMSDADILSRVLETAETLATGCVLTAYLKVRAIVLTEGHGVYSSNNLRRPRAASDLPIPAAYAFAIQQLGAVNVADLPTDLRVIPCFPETGHTFGLTADHPWNPNAYSKAVEYARSLGMRFAIVDLNVKNGTAWWLFRQHFDEDVFELQCIIPEVNYTDAMAVTHTLFLTDSAGDPSRTFVNITSFGNANYGTMVHNPHPGINLSTFEALSDTANEVWSNV